MRFLFAAAPLAAHLDWGGYLATAAALRAAGHDVLFVSGETVRAPVEAAGVPFDAIEETGFRWPPPPPLRPRDVPSPQEYDRLRRARSLDQWLDVERVADAVEAFGRVAARFQPELVVAEPFVAAPGVWAEQANCPFVVAGWPAHAPGAETPAVLEARARLALLCERTGTRGANFTASGAPALQSPLLHLTYWSARWFGDASLLAQTRHAGGRALPAAAPDPSIPSPDDRPWVLITLGTSFNHDVAFFRMAAEAAVDLGCLPILATGELSIGEALLLQDRLPAPAVVRPRVDFASVLPWCSAAIQHGGAGTTHALITHGVPQIVAPHAGDQARQALGVQRTGVGVAMQPREVNVERLRAALALILPDRAPARAAAATLQAEFAALGGVPQAARWLEAAVGAAVAGRNPGGRR